MKNKFSILILEHNRYIRQFLKRELELKGYAVCQVYDTRNLLKHKQTLKGARLIILDPYIADSSGISILELVNKNMPGVPIILHADWPDTTLCSKYPSIIACVEKSGSSIETIQGIILNIYPRKCEYSQAGVDTHDHASRHSST